MDRVKTDQILKLWRESRNKELSRKEVLAKKIQIKLLKLNEYDVGDFYHDIAKFSGIIPKLSSLTDLIEGLPTKDIVRFLESHMPGFNPALDWHFIDEDGEICSFEKYDMLETVETFAEEISKWAVEFLEQGNREFKDALFYQMVDEIRESIQEGESNGK